MGGRVMVPKFRAWASGEKLMSDVEYINFASETVVLTDTMDCFNIADVELMQSTGLKDKNGVEIFEGNIVNYEDGEFSYIGSVKKDCYQFYINGIEPVDSYDFIDVSNTFDGTTSLTIIGNIYENPELLEVEQ